MTTDSLEGDVSTCEGDVLCREERIKAAKLYSNAVKWSFRQAHTAGMPEYGWTVDYVSCKCECLYFQVRHVCTRNWHHINQQARNAWTRQEQSQDEETEESQFKQGNNFGEAASSRSFTSHD